MSRAPRRNDGRERRVGSIWFLARLPRSSIEDQVVAHHILKHGWCKVRKFRLLRPTVIARESALLQNPPRCAVLRMTERVDPNNIDLAGHLHHCLQRFGGIPLPPSILRKDVAGYRFGRPFESQARASEQPAVRTRPDQVGPSRRTFPLGRTERQESPGISNRLMSWPSHVSRHLRITSVTFEHCVSIGHCRSGQNEPSCFKLQGCLQVIFLKRRLDSLANSPK